MNKELDNGTEEIRARESVESTISAHTSPRTSPMNFPVFTSQLDYQYFTALNAGLLARRREIENAYVGKVYEGYCACCNKRVLFRVPLEQTLELSGTVYSNYRENMVCSECHFNVRMRATVHIMKQLLAPSTRIYMTEQITPLYSLVQKLYPGGVEGSEYLGDAIALGESKDGVRNEDVTALTFVDGSFDAVCSCDVLEHVFDYRKALEEFARVLKPSGWLILTIPWAVDQAFTTIRARRKAGGGIEHLLLPEYHVDPLNTDGCLCVYRYGWDILQAVKNAGFSWAGCVSYWSKEYGYMGLGEQMHFVARK